MRKSIFKFWSVLLIVGLFFFVSSCDKDDPEGTLTSNMFSGTWINAEGISLGDGVLYITEGNNFADKPGVGLGDITCYDIGKVKGLAGVKTIPESGYATGIAVVSGHGYIMKIDSYPYAYAPVTTTYARLYVSKMIKSSGNIIGAKVKYQYPFEPY
jgi:hypothetical protein